MAASQRPVRVRGLHVDGARLFIVDDKGRVWERFSDMELGAWGLVELPDEPETPKPRQEPKGGRRAT